MGSTSLKGVPNGNHGGDPVHLGPSADYEAQVSYSSLTPIVLFTLILLPTMVGNIFTM
jgi:hypothetical protein